MDVLLQNIATQAGLAVGILLLGCGGMFRLYMLEREERKDLTKQVLDLTTDSFRTINEMTKLVDAMQRKSGV